MDVVSLLQNKNKCLRGFLELSAEYVGIAESGDLSGIDAFSRKRDRMMSIIMMHDRKIVEATLALGAEERSPSLIQSLNLLMQQEQEILAFILAADERITACIENEKNRILRDLAAAEKSKDMAGKFKSGWMPSAGEGLDQTV
jgi:hypothetical protein